MHKRLAVVAKRYRYSIDSAVTTTIGSPFDSLDRT